MRAKDFITDEDRINEVLPLIGAAARAAGGAAVKGLGQRMGKAVTGATTMPKKPNQIGQTMGDPDEVPKDAAQAQATDRAKDQMIKPGSAIQLPSEEDGLPQEFNVSRIQGDEVEIDNPRPVPGEPQKIVFKKDDVKRSMKI